MALALILKILAIGGALVAGVSSVWYFHLPDDNPVEEISEEIIKEETGITVDLSPTSKEKGDDANK